MCTVWPVDVNLSATTLALKNMVLSQHFQFSKSEKKANIGEQLVNILQFCKSVMKQLNIKLACSF